MDGQASAMEFDHIPETVDPAEWRATYLARLRDCGMDDILASELEEEAGWNAEDAGPEWRQWRDYQDHQREVQDWRLTQVGLG